MLITDNILAKYGIFLFLGKCVML